MINLEETKNAVNWIMEVYLEYSKEQIKAMHEHINFPRLCNFVAVECFKKNLQTDHAMILRKALILLDKGEYFG